MPRLSCCLWSSCVLLGMCGAAAGEPLATGLKMPESVAVGSDGLLYVTTMGEFGKQGDGAIVTIADGKATAVATGLDDPKGIASHLGLLYFADRGGVFKMDATGQVAPFAPVNAFPSPPRMLNDVAVDPESGTVYVSDSGDSEGKGGAVYRVSPQGLVDVVTNQEQWPQLGAPNGLLMDGASHLLMLDMRAESLYRLKLADGSPEKLAEGLGTADGLAWDHHGQLFISDWKGGRVVGMARPGEQPALAAEGLQSAADICLAPGGASILVPDMLAGTLNALPTTVAGAVVDTSPLEIETEAAFAGLHWTGWSEGLEQGNVAPLRPIVLTHAGDGSGRVFVATQHGVVHLLPGADEPAETRIFLDLKDRVRYDDNMNEEGFLGMAFHPRFRENGELFVFYTRQRAPHPHTNVVSRFRLSADNPDRADPDSEEELLVIEHPFWNHDGGTIVFGPDGYLYVALGDGGAANDPYGNGQNLQTLLGTVLRIDVDRREDGKAYAIPQDNPFVGRDDARGEIWAYGLRNVWRLAFDPQTGACWAADVGQNLWEEINLLESGGNYGWNLREGLHPFGAGGVGVRQDLIDPIWEYHHDVGKSITGGLVYRGKRLPELEGHYLYADYVSGALWALLYDAKAGRVVANRPIRSRNLPIMSYGEDEAGEAYIMTYTSTGDGIFRFVPAR